MTEEREVEELTADLKAVRESDNQEHGPWGYKEQAQQLYRDGWRLRPPQQGQLGDCNDKTRNQ